MKKTLMLSAGFALALTMGAVATSASAADRLSGGYFVVSWEGDEPNDETARPLTAEDYDRLAYLQRVCDRQMKAQRPNAVAEVTHDVAVGAATNFVGVGLGAKLAFGKAADVVDYGIYGAGAGAGSGLNMGFTGRRRANRYDQGQCMHWQVSWSQRYKGNLTGKAIVMNAHSINGRGLKRPNLTEAQAEAEMDRRAMNSPRPEPTPSPPSGTREDEPLPPPPLP